MPGSGLLSKTPPKGEGALTLVPDLGCASRALQGGAQQGGAQRPGLSPAHAGAHCSWTPGRKPSAHAILPPPPCLVLTPKEQLTSCFLFNI